MSSAFALLRVLALSIWRGLIRFLIAELDPSEVAYRERLNDRLARSPEDIYWMVFRESEADDAKDLHWLSTQALAQAAARLTPRRGTLSALERDGRSPGG